MPSSQRKFLVQPQPEAVFGLPPANRQSALSASQRQCLLQLIEGTVVPNLLNASRSDKKVKHSPS
jgi:hypothetical protein